MLMKNSIKIYSSGQPIIKTVWLWLFFIMFTYKLYIQNMDMDIQNIVMGSKDPKEVGRYRRILPQVTYLILIVY